MDGSHGVNPLSYSSFSTRPESLQLTENSTSATTTVTSNQKSIIKTNRRIIRNESNNKTPSPSCMLYQDLLALYNELKAYDVTLVEKPAILFINKSDLTQPHLSPELKKLANKLNLKIYYGRYVNILFMVAFC